MGGEDKLEPILPFSQPEQPRRAETPARRIRGTETDEKFARLFRVHGEVQNEFPVFRQRERPGGLEVPVFPSGERGRSTDRQLSVGGGERRLFRRPDSVAHDVPAVQPVGEIRVAEQVARHRME
ncbi:hypothetical protein SDC9_172623 [bioreactor metagenome]|uniref:Uncharacterized protein n=1 Tax=bioreactor metagenome TaxID=1076179 RepID=A0A645GGB8_9ZZZZ